MRKSTYRCILSGITVGALLLSPLLAFAEEENLEPASEEELIIGANWAEDEYSDETSAAEYVVEETDLTEGEDDYIENVISEDHDDTLDELADGLFVEDTLEAAEETDIPIDEEHFPDPIFRRFVSDYFDTDDDKGVLSSDEINQVEEIYIDGDELCDEYELEDDVNIESLAGIEYFVNLLSLDISNCSLSTLDLSSNSKLEELSCDLSGITSLDITKNTALTSLSCFEGRLTSLTVGNHPSLENLDCAAYVTSLDVSGCESLKELQCTWWDEGGVLEEIKLDGCTALKRLVCCYNQLTSLDVSECTLLEELICYNNQLTSLNVNNNPNLVVLDTNNNNLKALNVKNCTLLEGLYCSWNEISSLEMGNHPHLGRFSCSWNKLENIDVSSCIALQELWCGANPLQGLDVSNNSNLIFLHCYQSGLKDLNIRNNTQLEELYCHHNQLTTLDISNCAKLKDLYLKSGHYSKDGVEMYGTYDEEEEDGIGLWVDFGVSIITGTETAHTHTFGAWTVTVPATEDSEGLQVRTCSGCGQTETATVPRVAVNITISKTPSGVKAKAAAKGKATITWKKFKQTKKTKVIWKKIKKVQIQCATDSAFTNIVKSTMVGKKKTKATIKGLAKKTTYYVRVRYYDGTGYSAWSGVKKVKTK